MSSRWNSPPERVVTSASRRCSTPASAIAARIASVEYHRVRRRTRFTVIGKVDVDVEGTKVNAWKVEEHRESDNKLLATWYLLDKSPYMVYGEVPLPNGQVQRMTEVEVPLPVR